jgi:1,4-alpha-glucan branching enzyme
VSARGAPLGYVAIVLHAHLPYVRHPEHERSLEERWLYEALWETYLPLVDLLDRFADEGVVAPISLSVSPTLAAMWSDPLLRRRFLDHVSRTRRLAQHAIAQRPETSEEQPALRHHAALLGRAVATFERHGGDVLAALVRHHREGRLDLFTTSATHAFLPGLAPSPAWLRAQLEIGRRAFESMTGLAPPGLWLPECAYAPSIDEALARAGARFTVLDAHGIALGEPRPSVATLMTERGALIVPTAAIESAAGVIYFGRDLWAGRTVWAMDGYPSDPAYREFHRDLGFDAPESQLLGELGPDGTRIATGLKLHRITGPGPHKAPYEPEPARARAAAHAATFADDRARFFAALPRRRAPPLSVVPFDAELFGHFWHEGPMFLEALLRRLAKAAVAGGPAAISLSEYADRHRTEERAQPATSTWGEGGFGATWTGPRTAALWRHVHHASAAVQTAVRAARRAEGIRGAALDQAIIEALLLQSSDFAFMIHRRTTAAYGERRAAEHAAAATRLAALATSGDIDLHLAAWIRSVGQRAPFLHDLPSEALRAPFDSP